MTNFPTQPVNFSIEMSPVEVTKKINFVWLGKLGSIQQDYIRVWKKINPDYQVTIWYDPQAFLAHELGKQIKSFAAQKLIVGKKSYFNKVIQLQNNAHEFISQAMEIEGSTFDQAAKEFMITKLNCSDENLDAIIKENKASYSDFVQQYSGLVQVADIHTLDDTNTGIDKYYYQELTLRQNLAAASDIARLKMLNQQGGFYFDADLLPALNTTIFNKSIQTKISQLSGREKSQIEFVKTQLILERLSVLDSSHFPAREALTQSYENYVDKFEQKGSEYKNLVDEIRTAIDTVHTIEDFFQPLTQQYIESNSLRVAKHRGFRGINNNAIMAEAHSHKLRIVMEAFAKNYQRLEQHNLILIEKEGDQQTRYLNDPYAGVQFPEEANYRMDGLTESTATIEITGPGAILKAIKSDAQKQFGEDGQSQSFPIEQFSFDLFNTYTEEDAKSSWQKQHTASDFSYEELLLAIKAKQPDLVRKLLAYQSLSHHDGFEWLSIAINNRDEETLRLLLEADVDPNSHNKVKKNSQKQTALMKAVDSGDITLVNRLLEYGARDEGGALFTAINRNNVKLVERLSVVELYSHLTKNEKGKLYKQALKEAKLKQDLFKKSYKNSIDISERKGLEGAINQSGSIVAIINEQKIAVRKNINPDSHKVSAASTNSTFDDVALYDKKQIKDWHEPALNSPEKSTGSRFDSQLVIQLENDPAVRDAAAQLVGKSPDTSVLIQLNDQGETRSWHLNINGEWVEGIPKNFVTEGQQRWQVVGHARDGEVAKTLGNYTAKDLKEQLLKLPASLDINTSPERINLVNCSLVNIEGGDSYLHQFVSSFTQQDISPSSVSAYTTRVVINEDNQKRLTDIGEKVIMNHENDRWVVTSNIPGKGVQSISEHQQLTALKQGLDFELGMKQLYLENRLSDSEWLPVFQTLKEDASQTRSYSLEFICKDSPSVSRIVKTNDSRIPNFIHEYDRQLALFKAHIDIAASQPISSSKVISEAEGVHGLNTAFIIQTLFNQHNRDNATEEMLPENLKHALQVHTYASWAQMGWDSVDDTLKYIGLWKELTTKGQAAKGGFKAVSRASPFVGIGLNILSVGLDGYELANAQNEAQRTVFGTQLGFDLVGLTNTAVSLGAATFGAPTAASFIGYLGVPIAGLGIGITALVQGTQVHIEKTKAVGRYFWDLDKGYQKGGYQIVDVRGVDGTTHRMWKNSLGIAIDTLDLRNQKLTFADTWIYKTHVYGLGSGYSNHTTWVTPVSVNRVGTHKEATPKQKVINIREGINHPAATAALNLSTDIPLILPDTPQYYMDYSYETFPFVTSRDDWGFDVLRRIESNYRDNEDNFSFDFYNFPSERAISELMFEFVATPVRVLLDDSPRTIIMPLLPDETRGKMAYILAGGNSTYHISLQEGATLTLSQGSSATQWVLDARALEDANKPQFDPQGRLLTGKLPIAFSDDFQGKLNLVNNDGIFAVDVQKKRVTLERRNVNANNFKNWQTLHDHLKYVGKTDTHHQPFIPVNGYRTPAGELTGIAYYETARDRFIYTNMPEKAEFLGGAQLAKVENDQAWLYRDDRAWLVDISTGNVLREYLPLNASILSGSTTTIIPTKSQLISSDGGVLYFIVEYQNDSGAVSYTWQLSRESQQLIGITGEVADLQKILSMINDNKDASSQPIFNSEHTLLAERSQELHLLGRQDGISYHSWFKKPEEKQEYQMFLRMNLANAPEDIQQITMTTGEKTSYYFYSSSQQKLYFQMDDGIADNQSSIAHEVKSNIDSLSIFQGQLAAQCKDGTLWITDQQGNLRLMGVMDNWVLKHRENILVELRDLAIQEATLPAIRIQGIYDSKGNPIITWYDLVAEKLIQGGTGIDASNDIHYRGLTPDGKQAWLYDSVHRQLYLQPLRQDTELVISDVGQNISAIPPAKRWSQEQYLSVVSVSDKLQLTTTEGAVLLMNKDAEISDPRQLIAWQETALTSENKVEVAIDALRGKVLIAPVIRYFSEKKQTPSWYLTEQKIFIHAQGLNVDHDLRYLGQANGQLGSYIHDQSTTELWQVSSSGDALALGKYRFISLNENTPLKGELVLQSVPSDRAIEYKLPMLEGMDRLMISGQTEGARYLLDGALFSHYRQIILDERGKQPIISLPDLNKGLIRHNGQDLVWYDPQSKAQLLITNPEKMAEQGMTFKIANAPELSATTLLQSLGRLQAASAEKDDWFTFSFSEGHYQLQSADQDQMILKHHEVIGFDINDTYRFVKGDGNVVIDDQGGEDTLSFTGITHDQLVFSRDADNLVINIPNSEDSVSIQGAFSSSSGHQIERITTSGSVTLDTSLLYHAMKELLPSETVVSLPGGSVTIQDNQGRVSQLPLDTNLMWKGSGVVTIEDPSIKYRKINPLNLLLLKASNSNPSVIFDRHSPDLDTTSAGKIIQGSRENKNVISVSHGYGIHEHATVYGGLQEDSLQITGDYAKLIGYEGNDIYRVGGTAKHTIILDTKGEHDILSLEYADIKPSEVILQREGNNLQISVADSGLITIKNQFTEDEGVTIEELSLTNEKQNWHYSLIDTMSSLKTEKVFGLSEAGGLLQRSDLTIANCFHSFCRTENAK